MIWTIDDVEGKKETQRVRRGSETQNNAPWGLAAISHRKPGHTDYVYDDDDTGKGYYAYVVDTGIRTSHEDFEGRAENVWTKFNDGGVDNEGHGTHIAGSIGGKKYGVAKKASLLGVKAFETTHGYSEDIVDALAWTMNNIVTKQRQKKSVINMSIAGPKDDGVNYMVELAVKSNIVVVGAAGNKCSDAEGFSPASAKAAITVGAVDQTWRIWEDSNFGELIDIFAPGAVVESAGIKSDTDVDVRSGTSMATAYVSGLVLNLLDDDTDGPEDIKERLLKNATPKAVKGVFGGTTRVLANNNEDD